MLNSGQFERQTIRTHRTVKNDSLKLFLIRRSQHTRNRSSTQFCRTKNKMRSRFFFKYVIPSRCLAIASVEVNSNEFFAHFCSKYQRKKTALYNLCILHTRWPGLLFSAQLVYSGFIPLLFVVGCKWLANIICIVRFTKMGEWTVCNYLTKVLSICGSIIELSDRCFFQPTNQPLAIVHLFNH